MRFLQLVLYHIKRTITTPSSCISMFVAPLGLTILLMSMSSSGESMDKETAILFGSGNEALEEDLLSNEVVLNNYVIEEGISLDEAKARLDQNDYVALYYVPDNFIESKIANEDEMIHVYSLTGEQTDPNMDLMLLDSYKKVLREHYWADLGVEADAITLTEQNLVNVEEADNYMNDVFAGMMGGLFGLLVMYGPGLAAEYAQFRKNQVLKRLAISPNSSFVSMGSMIVAYGVFLVAVALLIGGFLVITDMIDIRILPIFMAYYAATVLFILSFSLFLFRIFKEEQVVQGVGTLIGFALMILAFMPLMLGESTLLNTLGLLSPLYSAFEGIASGSYFPGIPIILLGAAILFTAGSYGLEDYAQS